MNLRFHRFVIPVSVLCVSIATGLTPAQSDRPLIKFGIVVIDRAGHPVDGVRKEDLQLIDDGNQETISYFSKEERPLICGLVIDGSGSLRPEFQEVLKAANQIIEGKHADDSTFIIKFVSNDNIKILQELTTDKHSLANTLRGLKVETGRSAVIDGLYQAAQYAIQHRPAAGDHHMTLVVISDGEDRASYYQESELFKLLSKNDLQVFVVGLVNELDSERGLVRSTPRQKAEELLTKLAKETGGRAFLLNSPKQLPDTIKKLSEILHPQYVVGYQPTKDPDKAVRKVQMKVAASPGHEKWTVINPRVLVVK